ncbi:MAG TPA: hypothetical protein VEL31_05740 [Ktedonobacteraceae bacterium]|nr:hypothetical protein [Ktedonobacteraceae bacterium]
MGIFSKSNKEEQQPTTTKSYGMQFITCPTCKFTTPGCLCEQSQKATPIQLSTAAAERKNKKG